MSGSFYAEMTRMIRGATVESAGGKLALVLEGGYDLTAIADGTAAVLEALAEPPDAGAAASPPDIREGRAAQALETARSRLSPYWELT